MYLATVTVIIWEETLVESSSISFIVLIAISEDLNPRNSMSKFELFIYEEYRERRWDVH